MHLPLIGVYRYADDIVEAAHRLRHAGHRVTILSPVPLEHEIEHVFGERKNHIRPFTFVGAILGFILGFVLCFGTAAMYVLPRGGKPIFSFTPTLLISYEMSILVGVFFTLGGFLLLTRLPFYGKKAYDPVVNVDGFGLLVEDIREDRYEEVEALLKESGAEEVRTLVKD